MINVIQQPALFTPAQNPVIFQIESSFPDDIRYFKVEILDAATSTIISRLDIVAPPDYPGGSYVNLSGELKNLVHWVINNAISVLSAPIIKEVFEYKVRITERGLVAGKMADLDSAHIYLSDSFFVWEANLDRITFHNFTLSDYLLSAIGLPVKFLTTKPNNSVVNDYSSEQLYFLHDDTITDLNVVVKTYLSDNSLFNTYTNSISDLVGSNITRIQVSPKALSDIVEFTNVAYYTVELQDSTNVRRSEIRRYNYRELECNQDPVNLIWFNPLGGFDSYQFVNVTEVNNITRNTIKKSIYRIHNGIYTDRVNEILNAPEEVINTTQEGSYTANSVFITDAEGYWLNSLFTSTQVFVELTDNSLVPVIVTNTSYAIQKQKYNNTSFDSIQVTYTFSGEIIPPEVLAVTVGSGSGFGDGNLEADFIDSQMNYGIGFDTALTFVSLVTDGAEGVGGAVAATNANLKFEFNKIVPRLGLTTNMSIVVSSTLTIVIDFLADYIGKPFQLTGIDSTVYNGTFINGTVTF